MDEALDRTLDAERAPAQKRRDAVAEPHFLVLLECDRPLALSARYHLGAGGVARIGRGPTRQCRRNGDYRGAELTITVPDKRMSATHAELRGAQSIWTLRDVGSRNGIRINGQPIQEHVLTDGDLIELGHTLCLFRLLQKDSVHPDIDLAEEPPAAAGLGTLVPELADSFRRLAQIARANLAILITGETGTGKEVTAKAVHQLAETEGRFIGVNCGAIPASLIEGELFGSSKGAFSGAVTDRPGLIRDAHQGTLFLDEIAELPLASQAAFLRVLQERRVRPVGGSHDLPVTIRLASATNQDIEQRVREGTFRNDLFARIAGFRIRLPPLRERREDLGLLVGHLMDRIANGNAPVLTVEAAKALLAYDFPLNIRELENWLTTAVALSAGNPIGVEHLPEPVDLFGEGAESGRSTPTRRPLTEEQERHKEEVIALLRDHGGNVSAVARTTGKARNQVQRWIRRYALRIEDYR